MYLTRNEFNSKDTHVRGLISYAPHIGCPFRAAQVFFVFIELHPNNIDMMIGAVG